MRLIILILFSLLLSNCNKPKTVMICGDHVCINNAEAKQFFEENLTLEVRVLNEKSKKTGRRTRRRTSTIITIVIISTTITTINAGAARHSHAVGVLDIPTGLASIHSVARVRIIRGAAGKTNGIRGFGSSIS